MARSSANDPLEKFRFRMQWLTGDGMEPTSLARAGFHDIQMPKRATNKIMYREGIDKDISSISAGLSTMEDIVLSRGVLANDTANEMYKWMSTIHKPGTIINGYGAGKESSTPGEAAEYRKDLKIEMFDRTGAVVRGWKLYNVFPVNFVPGSDLNASEDGEKSLEQLTLTYEDFEEVVVTEEAATDDGVEQSEAASE